MNDERKLFELFDNMPEPIRQGLFVGVALLGNSYLSCVERQQACQDQSQHEKALQEELEKIRQTLRCQAEEIRKWQEDWRTQQERMKGLEQEVEEKTSLETAKADLEAQNRDLHERLQAAQDARNTVLEEQKDQARLLQEKADALEQLKEEYRELQPAWSVYKKYKAWIAQNGSKVQLGWITCDSFAAFISCYRNKDVLKYIYQELASRDLWSWDDKDIQVFDALIDCFCALRHLGRAEQKGVYNFACHRKRQDAPSSGSIGRILLRGVVEEDGSVLEGCQSFVEMTEYPY